MDSNAIKLIHVYMEYRPYAKPNGIAIKMWKFRLSFQSSQIAYDMYADLKQIRCTIFFEANESDRQIQLNDNDFN